MALDALDPFNVKRRLGRLEGIRGAAALATDFGFLRSAFGQPPGSAGYVAYLDANNDGVVDLIDFGAFRTRFGVSLFP